MREKGYRIDGHALVPLGNLEAGDLDAGASPAGNLAAHDGGPENDDGTPLHAGWEAARHRTAMVRYGFSAPIQSLAQHGFLDGRYRLFNYGCGRGDDLRGLCENGLSATGWDPYFAPDQSLETADLRRGRLRRCHQTAT